MDEDTIAAMELKDILAAIEVLRQELFPLAGLTLETLVNLSQWKPGIPAAELSTLSNLVERAKSILENRQYQHCPF